MSTSCHANSHNLKPRIVPPLRHVTLVVQDAAAAKAQMEVRICTGKVCKKQGSEQVCFPACGCAHGGCRGRGENPGVLVGARTYAWACTCVCVSVCAYRQVPFSDPGAAVRACVRSASPHFDAWPRAGHTFLARARMTPSAIPPPLHKQFPPMIDPLAWLKPLHNALPFSPGPHHAR